MKFCPTCGQPVAEEIGACPACGRGLQERPHYIDDYRIVDVLHEGYSTFLCRAVRERTDEHVMIRLFTPRVQDLFSLRGQAALVTGGGAGIGKSICLMFAEAGADVACTDLKLDEAESVASECGKFGIQAFGFKLDVMNEAERCTAVDRAVKQFGKLTILVNNAGGGGPKPFDMPSSDFERAFQLNLFSVFRMCQLCAPHMKAGGGGAIINISSMAGQNKNKRMCSYGASKAAVAHLTRDMAFDLGPDKIRVNARF